MASPGCHLADQHFHLTPLNALNTTQPRSCREAPDWNSDVENFIESHQLADFYPACPGRRQPHQHFHRTLLNTSNKPKSRSAARIATSHQKMAKKRPAKAVQNLQAAILPASVRSIGAIVGQAATTNRSPLSLESIPDQAPQ